MTAIAAAVTAVALIAPTAPTDVDPLDVISPGLLIAAEPFEDTGTTADDEHAMLTQRIHVERLESLGTSRTIRERRLAEKHPRHRAVVEAGRQSAADRYAARVARAEAARARRLAAEEAARAAARKAAEQEHAAPVPSRGSAARSATTVLPVSGYRLTARFGQSGSRWARDHTGLDFAAPTGTKVRAPQACEVTFAGSAGAYGNKVECDTGSVEFWFAHLSRFDVSVGDDMDTGELIGRVGATGNVTGPHLHFEVHPNGGGPVDPDHWLTSKGVRP
ncbi:M23 family metallopeptidase [Streptomyces sp.]|uniref:M23 family metallopeptidase n=1 Tax=Streptomyces sp. TaxID=1931 RepID=UPI002F9597D8